MHLHCVLMVLVAILAASNGAVSATIVKEDSEHVKINRAHSIQTLQTDTRRKRFLRTEDKFNTDYYYDPAKRDDHRSAFIENKLEKSLTNPRKTTKLYEQWYKRGYTLKRVSSGLNQDENRELQRVYQELAHGYAAYIKKVKRGKSRKD
ncbi:RXLR domain-containing protein [Phytophthora infestans]|uniref:RxLR effector protein n=1 Tax=Phytophthora infestans TaxID=4787 RepID=A0A833WAD7_PHYIN|nr:RXLR domain-containing protein [Phytophthora infestans]